MIPLFSVWLLRALFQFLFLLLNCSQQSDRAPKVKVQPTALKTSIKASFHKADGGRAARPRYHHWNLSQFHSNPDLRTDDTFGTKLNLGFLKHSASLQTQRFRRSPVDTSGWVRRPRKIPRITLLFVIHPAYLAPDEVSKQSPAPRLTS